MRSTTTSPSSWPQRNSSAAAPMPRRGSPPPCPSNHARFRKQCPNLPPRSTVSCWALAPRMRLKFFLRSDWRFPCNPCPPSLVCPSVPSTQKWRDLENRPTARGRTSFARFIVLVAIAASSLWWGVRPSEAQEGSGSETNRSTSRGKGDRLVGTLEKRSPRDATTRPKSTRPNWRSLPPAELEAKLKLMRERLESFRQDLRQKQLQRPLLSNEVARWDRLEEVRQRMDAGGPLARPTKTPRLPRNTGKNGTNGAALDANPAKTTEPGPPEKNK